MRAMGGSARGCHGDLCARRRAPPPARAAPLGQRQLPAAGPRSAVKTLRSGEGAGFCCGGRRLSQRSEWPAAFKFIFISGKRIKKRLKLLELLLRRGGKLSSALRRLPSCPERMLKWLRRLIYN